MINRRQRKGPNKARPGLGPVKRAVGAGLGMYLKGTQAIANKLAPHLPKMTPPKRHRRRMP